MTADIVDATPADAAAIAALIAEAFQHLDVAQWLVPPSAEQRRSVLEADFRIFVDHALSHGIVQTSPNRTGVAMWFPPAAQAREPADYDVRLAAACGPWIDRFRALDTAFAEHHPHSPAHHHLGFLAVRPDRQCRGLGSDLLRHHHQRLDEAGLP
ncbi:MAG: GNAT family N-acetyltransferase, partial [Kutzneria sp.]|nr:GNAT family N-acetyltransferase [Kutzneria sp.]